MCVCELSWARGGQGALRHLPPTPPSPQRTLLALNDGQELEKVPAELCCRHGAQGAQRALGVAHGARAQQRARVVQRHRQQQRRRCLPGLAVADNARVRQARNGAPGLGVPAGRRARGLHNVPAQQRNPQRQVLVVTSLERTQQRCSGRQAGRSSRCHGAGSRHDQVQHTVLPVAGDELKKIPCVSRCLGASSPPRADGGQRG